MNVKRWAGKAIIILVVFLLLVFLALSFLSWKNNYYDRVYPGVKIGDLDLSGKTFLEAKEVISSRTQKIESAGLKFQAGQKQAVVAASIASFDSDLSYPALTYEVEETVQKAFGSETNRTFISYLWHLLTPKRQRLIEASYTIDQERIKKLVSDNFPELQIIPANAYFSIDKNGQLKSNTERLGKEINYDLLFEEINSNLKNLKNNPITIKTRTEYPTVKQADLVGLEKTARDLVGQNDLILEFSEKTEGTSTENIWHLKPDRLITWISVQKTQDKFNLSLDLDKVKQYLSLSVASKIDAEAIRPRFEIANGKVTSWENGLNGRRVDIEATAEKISQDFLAGQRRTALIIKEIAAAENIGSENNFNIKEIIGTGHSNFSGSPENRRKNIAVGANAVHGMLIKPGEEFSLVKTLGEVSDKTGYLPELVIKGNKTTPEYGGGLCQIGTTVFRTALASGLPITARQNHSYRVGYYEPAGTDAAVYIPWPDVRFVNDTNNYILIQARINKNDLYFDFWGVKDGRIATTTKPSIYNIVKPEPTKIIETDTLPAGEKKCTEKAHNGADAYFDYKVIYPDGATTTPIQERRFKSHYVPWQEVCLIGSATSTKATSTPENINGITATSTNKKATGTTPAASTP